MFITMFITAVCVIFSTIESVLSGFLSVFVFQFYILLSRLSSKKLKIIQTIGLIRWIAPWKFEVLKTTILVFLLEAWLLGQIFV